MSGPTKDVLLVGFGAVGVIYSLILKRSGLVNVTSVARSNYEIVQSQGIDIKSRKYGNIDGWRPNRLVNSVSDAADRAYSHVLITTKAIPDVKTTSSILAPLLSAPYIEKYPQPTYVLLQNGLNVEVDLYHSLRSLNIGPPKIVSAAVYIGTNLLAPNVVEHNHFGRLALGVYRHNDYTTTVNTPEEDGGSTIQIVPEVQRMKFRKNLWNVAFASFATLTNHPLSALLRPPPPPGMSYSPFVAPATAEYIEKYTFPTIRALLQELIALGRVIGFSDAADGLPSSALEETIELARSFHAEPDSNHITSMLLDARMGRPIEVEVILGEVVRMAENAVLRFRGLKFCTRYYLSSRTRFCDSYNQAAINQLTFMVMSHTDTAFSKSHSEVEPSGNR
ncbi:ketopantoate reductase PanE/ApbA-domain-containing protein [Infundibulicybe gibba]|nr:ketopantoate reductase PanE/ApbA-domain-containing protein [Infundibulicybe gibba]